MTIAIYPGSFDPITNGHLDVACRAARIFDKLIIGIFATPGKSILFSVDERLDLAREAVAKMGNITVEPYTGLTVDFAKKVGALAIVRGLRIGSDFEFEFQMAMMNRKLCPDLEMVCLMATSKYQFLSASLIKEVTALGGNIDDFVPRHVAVAIRDKLGITQTIL